MTNYVAEAITEHFGERCPDYEDGCPCCEAWAQYDALAKPPEKDIDDRLAVSTIATGRQLADTLRRDDQRRTRMTLRLLAFEIERLLRRAQRAEARIVELQIEVNQAASTRVYVIPGHHRWGEDDRDVEPLDPWKNTPDGEGFDGPNCA